jgi:threonyl-tRNA synthetase
LLKSVYQDFGYRDIHVGLSTRPEMRGGTEEMWDRAETDLQAAATAAGVEFDIMPGEGAFYGPKLEFALKDLKGRSWQCGTLQLDFLLPQRLKASYTGEDGNRHTPVMLHRAILGSLERFIGILLENYEGALPAWLAPTQVEIVTIKNSPELMNYAQKIEDQFEKNGVRTEIDSRDVHLNSRIKEHSGQKIPFIIVVGDRDLQNNTVSIRTLGNNQTRVEDCVSGIQELIEKCNATCAEV